MSATKHILSLHYNASNCAYLLFKQLIECLNGQETRPIILLCIGTDRCIGDAVGPFTGSFLIRHKPKHIHTFGNLEYPIHALNLKETIDFIDKNYHNPFIIAVDASLGQETRIGYINIVEGALSPGSALFKKLPTVGHYHITAIVNQLTKNRMERLQNTRLSFIVSISQIIAQTFIYLDIHLRKSASTPSISFSNK